MQKKMRKFDLLNYYFGLLKFSDTAFICFNPIYIYIAFNNKQRRSICISTNHRTLRSSRLHMNTAQLYDVWNKRK